MYVLQLIIELSRQITMHKIKSIALNDPRIINRYFKCMSICFSFIGIYCISFKSRSFHCKLIFHYHLQCVFTINISFLTIYMMIIIALEYTQIFVDRPIQYRWMITNYDQLNINRSLQACVNDENCYYVNWLVKGKTLNFPILQSYRILRQIAYILCNLFC